MKSQDRARYEALLVSILEDEFDRLLAGASSLQGFEASLRIRMEAALGTILREQAELFLLLLAVPGDGPVDVAAVFVNRSSYPTTRSAILARDLAASMNVPDPASRVSPARLAAIARTEVTAAASQAANTVAAVALGYERQWITMLDERVCPVCRPLHGAPYSRYSAQFPDGPPAHPQCRCKVVFVSK